MAPRAHDAIDAFSNKMKKKLVKPVLSFSSVSIFPNIFAPKSKYIIPRTIHWDNKKVQQNQSSLNWRDFFGSKPGRKEKLQRALFHR